MSETAEHARTDAHRVLVRAIGSFYEAVPGSETTIGDDSLLGITGWPTVDYNFVCLGSGSETNVATLRSTVDDLRAKRVPFALGLSASGWPRPEDHFGDFSPTPVHGFSLMTLGSIEEHLDGPPEQGTPFELRPVADAAGQRHFSKLTAEVFELDEHWQSQFAGAQPLEGANRSFWLGCVDGEPVSTGVVVTVGSTAWVSDITTREPFRGRGFGAQMVRHILGEGRIAGCKSAGLAAAEKAVPLYRRLGFEVVDEFRLFQSKVDE